MNCALALRMLDAYVDDELDAATIGQMADHLAVCAACRELHERRVAMRAALRAPALRHQAPVRLHRAILRDIEKSTRPALQPRLHGWRQALAIGGLAAVVGAMGGWWLAQPSAIETFPDLAVERHVAALTPAGPRIDVASSDRHVVRPWFQGRLEFAPMVRDLSGDGYELLGARVDHLGRTQAVAVVYRFHGHVIDVFSWRAVREGAGSQRPASIRGFNVVTWTAGDMDYAVVTDADAAELERFTAAYRGR